MRVPILAIAGLAGAILACGPAFAEITANLHCADGAKLTARFSPPDAKDGQVELAFAGGKTITLPQALSADGGRYAQGEDEFWTKGNGAMLTLSGKTTECEVEP